MRSQCSIAIVGMACIYPEARSPVDLWENAMAQRRAFRRLPDERLRLSDYWSADPTVPDMTYSTEAAVIEGYEFDRVAFRVVGSTYRSADPAHWLALEVAEHALADAGFPGGAGLPNEATGVLLGNTLTGEFSRANVLRLRWPYVRRVLDAALAEQMWAAQKRAIFLADLETRYKAPFPAVGEESLAGGLSNTIAGRICNQFDLKGGGYTVDGACASSLLAVANACSSLAAGDLDVALAGGVDLSLDPFEIVGFAKTGALAPQEMRVFDKRSAGFWPGEGCGFVVLMRLEDAMAQGRRAYSAIRGWGISSDGSGGITRPEADGQLEALRRAYRRAGFGPDTVLYCEGHGTGTFVGDATELEVLSRARSGACARGPLAVVGSVKANIGHCKAAAGVAGLIKATMAVHSQVLPPTTGCGQPHPHLTSATASLRVLREPEAWPADRPLRASVSAMGFGGINAHLVLEGVATGRRAALGSRERMMSQSAQDAELILFRGLNAADLLRQLQPLLAIAPRLSRSEVVDMAAQLEKQLGAGKLRAAVLASRPSELAARLQTLFSWVQAGKTTALDFAQGIFLGEGGKAPRIAFLFPGQGSPSHLDGGLWRRRFDSVRELYAQAALSGDETSVLTSVVQPAVATASLAGLKVLREFGITAEAAIGHSLGEIVALHWAGAFDEAALLGIARVRGAAMAHLGCSSGAMLAVEAPWSKVQSLLCTGKLIIVGFNSPRQTVVAGEASEIMGLAKHAQTLGLRVIRLPVSHAFHTPFVAGAVPVLANALAQLSFQAPTRPVFSTVTGTILAEHEDLRFLLCRQVTSAVRFGAALAELLDAGGGGQSPESRIFPGAGAPDLLIEVGPGGILSSLVGDTANVSVVAMDACGESVKGLLLSLGAAFALGAPLRHEVLFSGRFTRPFDLDWKPKFFVNPCELAPKSETAERARTEDRSLSSPSLGKNPLAAGLARTSPTAPETSGSVLELVRQLVSDRAELPQTAVQDQSRLLSDLHLNSISVGQLVSEAAKMLSLPRLVGLTDFADSSVAEVALALEELKKSSALQQPEDERRPPPGVDTWIRGFEVELVEAKRPRWMATAEAVGVPAETEGWQVFAPIEHPFAEALCQKLSATGGCGVLLCLPEATREPHVTMLLAAGRAVLSMKSRPRFVLARHDWSGGGFARTLHQEMSGLTTCVVNIPAGHSQTIEWVLAEAASASGYMEAHYDAQGRRFEPRLKSVPIGDPKPSAQKSRESFPIGSGDVLLVTGGGKGIAAECALSLAHATGAGLALMGRSDPALDRELANNLERIRAAGVPCFYARADVTDGAAVREAVKESERKLGPVTAILHAAGVNTPQLIRTLEEAAFHATLAPKLQGLCNVLAAVDSFGLRLLITFGSIIARAGLRGEADYATANEWMTEFTKEFRARHSGCRCHAFEWSVWSGVGMGERLGRMEALISQGITPIPLGEGVRLFKSVLGSAASPLALVVTGRFGEPPTLKFTESDLPLWRFLERRRAFYPSVELIVDASLSFDADPYLNDHVVQKEMLFPAVLGLEAMAQAAMALIGSAVPPSFEQVALTRPIVVSAMGPTTIRIATLRRTADIVEVCIRTEATDFHVDHFRALCRFHLSDSAIAKRLKIPSPESEKLRLDPAVDLYGGILFHRGRFCRLGGYHLLKAKECLAEITPDNDVPWFGPFLPAEFVLGDPGARDATLHAVQACIPHSRILPAGIDHITIHRIEKGPRFVHACERFRNGSEFVYDLEVADAGGEIVEVWEGLHLRSVGEIQLPEAWPEPLAGPYIERRLEELAAGSSVRVALEKGGRARRSDEAIQHALGHRAQVWHRPDGKPVTLEKMEISASHSGSLTLAVACEGRLGGDLEQVSGRASEVWRELLGEDSLQLARLIATERPETLDAAATRLWSVRECLKKSGGSAGAPLVLDALGADGWVVFRSGSMVIATCIMAVRGAGSPMVVGVAIESLSRGTNRGTLAMV